MRPPAVLAAVAVCWLSAAVCVAGGAATPRDDASQDSSRHRRQAVLSSGGGCADMSLFNYMLYYYLIQAQNNHDKHSQADQMAAALLKLKRSRGTDPIPTLISTTSGQNALLAMLQNVAQNNPAQLLALLTSIRGRGAPQPPPQPRPQTLAGFSQGYGQGFPSGGGGFGNVGGVSGGGGFGGYPTREQLYQQGFPPSGSSFGGLQASRTLYSPQVQQALYRPQPAPAVHSPQFPFAVGDEKLDNSLQFSPSLRRQVYAPQPELEPTPAPARTVIREPSTRLHVSTVTLVTTVLSSQRSTVPLVYNGQSTTTEILATATHTVTATKLQTLAVVVTPTVVEAHGQTTTLYGGTGSPAAEIVTDLNYQDEPAAAVTPAGITATVQPQPVVNTAALEGLPAPAAQQAAAALGQLLIQPGHTPPLGAVVQPAPTAVTTTTTATTTTTTRKPDRLLALLKSRAAARRRGTPRLSAPRRGDPRRRKKNNQQTEAARAEEHVSTSVSVSVSQPGQPSSEPVTLVNGVPVVQAVPISTTTPAPAPVFRPDPVPVYVEKDGVLVIAAAPLQPAAPVFRPETATAASTSAASPAPKPAPTAASVALTPAANVTNAAVTPEQTPASTTATAPPPPDEFSFDFEETVYASPSTSTEKVVTEEDFQNLLDGTFVILAESLPDAATTAAPPAAAEGSGQQDSDVKVSVSYAVSTSVSEGRRR